jgi:hypothetical protein
VAILGKTTITEIADDRVVLEQSTATGITLFIVRMKGGQQQVSRLQKGLVEQGGGRP